MSGPTSWEDIIEDSDWLDDDWGTVGSELDEPEPPPARERTPAELKAVFPAVDLERYLAERLDDIMPDPDAAGPPQWRRALEAIAEALDLAAAQKALAGMALWAPVASDLKADIRRQKEAIFRTRSDIKRKLDEYEEELERAREAGITPPTGFAAWGTAEDVKAAVDSAAERRKIVEETNKAVADIYAEVRRNNQIAAEKRIQAYNDVLFPRRYY